MVVVVLFGDDINFVNRFEAVEVYLQPIGLACTGRAVPEVVAPVSLHEVEAVAVVCRRDGEVIAVLRGSGDGRVARRERVVDAYRHFRRGLCDRVAVQTRDSEVSSRSAESKVACGHNFSVRLKRDPVGGVAGNV
jgi:hypothetical protein